ncbi:hypothetical protein BLS_000247 [Venturia inaequalis]|uniref:Arsenite methyltransferase n=1 Tax=Venturia inaequalis TaxID=5025 RepID=A0A8H3U5B0_VENIN|nr:hypothetical protein BLS_000247 [Venturia inaequalis]KAE9971787.1 hypothetical protein EG328_005365 [Venturia inaequalis]RDI77154.1 hypothetical protein Vi05172_g12902 [Venturia inaequalis]
MDQDQIYKQVQDHYGSLAQGKNIEYGKTVAKSFGYTEEELATTPQEANLGLSCGNPHAIASLREGETVIDLGSGAGFDVFLAAKKVGASGRVIGIDMNPEMLVRANENKTKVGADNVGFVESHITNIALESCIANCIISNCVVNLVPEEDKPLVFQEMFRLLKSGGRVAISDILAKQPMLDRIREDIALYCGCIAGASQVADYESYLGEAGFNDIVIVESPSDLNVYTSTNDDGTAKKAAENACCAGKTTFQHTGCSDACCGGERSTTKPCCSPVDTSEKTEDVAKTEGGGCCSTATETKKRADMSNARDLDLNIWAGSFKIYAIKQ